MVLPLFASLFGGALGARNERKAINAQNAYNHPSAIRARAEEAGFNPLLFIGPGVGQQTAVGGSNFMGSAIADAGMMLADKLAKRQDLRKLDAYKAQNQALQKQVNQMTLRPKVGGLYAQREAMPTRTAALGGVKDESDTSTNVNPALLGRINVPDARLDRANPGYFAGLTWQAAPGFSPGQTWEDRYGDTPMNWPIAAAQMAADIGYNFKRGQNHITGAVKGVGPVMSIGGNEFVMEPYVPRSRRPKPDLVPRWNNARPMFGGGF